MKDILFRGKRVDNGEWVCGYRIGKDVIVGEVVEMTEDYFYTEFWYVVDAETVGVGVKIKNRLFFENDIVILKGETKIENEKGIIKWIGDKLVIEWKSEYTSHIVDMMFWAEKSYFEVIGNIHDNKKLVEE